MNIRMASLLAMLLLGCGILVLAQDSRQPTSQPTTAKKDVGLKADVKKARTRKVSRQAGLDGQQQNITSRYKKFEKKLLQLAEFLRENDTERAELLKRAYGQSRDNNISNSLERITSLLSGEKRLGDAVGAQTEVVANLQALLLLLQSDDLKDSLKQEQERIKDLLKNLRTVIGKHKRARTANDRGEAAERVAQRQADAAKKARDLVQKIEGQDADQTDEQSKDGKSKDGKSKDGKSKDGKSKDGKSKDGQGKDGQGKDGKGKDGKGKDGKSKDGKGKDGQGKDGKGKDGKGKDGKGKDGKGKDGKSKDGKSKDGKSKDGQQSEQDTSKTPGRDEIKRARQEMERAIEELKKKSRESAADHQDEALRELLKAKEKLEEILRQLREEERKLLLAALEARFQKMLAMQLAVYRDTLVLGQVSADDWVGRHTTRSIKLARDEEEIAVEAIKALTLLKEEGSSVAFPEAVIELREDMLVVSRRLEESKVGQLTQAIEKDIIESLEEMIDALQKELEKSEDEQKDQKDQKPQQQMQEPPLVDKLSELKMLRALQLRINRRTRRLARLIDGDQAEDVDVLEQLKELARRQARVQKAARDLATGRNR